MSKILKTHPKSVQAHKDLILQCLDDRDESIRLRALDLLYGMVHILMIRKYLLSALTEKFTAIDIMFLCIFLVEAKLFLGQVSKKNLMEIVKKLMIHMDKAEGSNYRDELLSKIIEICSQSNFQFITNFEW